MSLATRLAFVTSLAAACTHDPTQLVVVVDSDISVPDPLDGVRVIVKAPGGATALDRRWPLAGPEHVVLPASFAVAPKGDDPTRVVTIDAIGIDGDARLVETRAITSFVEHERTRLVMFLSSACIGVVCPEELTCRGGECVDPRERPPDRPIDAGPARVDAAVDASADASADAGVDAAPPCDETPCRVVGEQCGCAEGEACALYVDGAPYCEAEGVRAEGELCELRESCRAGLICVGFPAYPGRCVPYCEVDADCGPGSSCTRLFSKFGVPVPGDIGACTTACDPRDLAGGGCPAPLGCRIAFTDGLDGSLVPCTVCAHVGAGVQADPCDDVGDCTNGTSCLEYVPDPARCLTVCTELDPTCPVPTACYGAEPPFIVGGVQYGVCR